MVEPQEEKSPTGTEDKETVAIAQDAEVVMAQHEENEEPISKEDEQTEDKMLELVCVLENKIVDGQLSPIPSTPREVATTSNRDSDSENDNDNDERGAMSTLKNKLTH